MFDNPDSDSTIKIVSYNSRGLRNMTISTLFDKFDIILLQQTQDLKRCKQDLGVINTLHPHFRGTAVAVTNASRGIIKGRPAGGVAVLYNISLSRFVKELDLQLD